MLPYLDVFPITNNYGFYGVEDNKLVIDDTKVKSLLKDFNRERATSIEEGNWLDCNEKNWTVDDWYEMNPCDEQKNTSHLEKALKRKGVKPHKFPIFFGSGNMASLLIPLLPDLSQERKKKEKKIKKYEIDFNFNEGSSTKVSGSRGLRFIAKDYRSNFVEVKHGHIAEYLLVTSEENEDRHIEIGRELTYLINSLEFTDSDVILFSSKEVDCLEGPLDAENVCEVKAYNGGLPTEYGIKHIQLVVKNFALGGIRKLAMITIENSTTISGFEDIDIETELNKERILESFYPCLNNFTKLIVSHCRENQLAEGSVETFRRGNERFMVIEDKEHFWCYQFDINSKEFSYRQKFPNSFSVIRWPLESKCPFPANIQIPDIHRYSFYDQGSNQVFRHVEGNCLWVVKNNSELDKAPSSDYKISMEDPIFFVVKEVLLQRYCKRKSNRKRKRQNRKALDRKRKRQNRKVPDWKRKRQNRKALDRKRKRQNRKVSDRKKKRNLSFF